MKTSIHLLATACALLLAGAAAAQSLQTYRYDANGRLTATTTAHASGGVFTSYALDDADNRTGRNNYQTAALALPYRLSSGEFLLPGQQLTSQDGRFALKAQPDGDLVLWFGATRLWSNGTALGSSLYFRLQTSGAATLFDVAQAPLWASPAAGANATLTLQNDGNLVLKNSVGAVVWQSSTCCH